MRKEVLGMLITTPAIEAKAVQAATTANVLSGQGAGLPSAGLARQQRSGSVTVRIRPRASWEAGVRDASVVGQRRMVAGASMTGLGHLSNPRALAGARGAYLPCTFGKQYPQTTRFAAPSGAKGPYPARDPV
jgi:hypothetical protein